MPKISNHREETQILNGSGRVLTVTRKGTVDVLENENNLAYAIWDKGDHNKTIIDGHIEAKNRITENNCVAFKGSGPYTSLTVGEHGSIAAYEAVAIATGVVRNAGDIHGRVAVGVRVIGEGGSVYNLHGGTISGDSAIHMQEAGKIVNEGTLKGHYSGVTMSAADGEQSTLINKGLIKAVGASFSSNFSGDNHIVNRGTMIGDIELSDGSNLVDTIGGKIRGDILGGMGRDILKTDNAKLTLVETTGGGLDDAVKSTVSYRLGNNVEYLYLLGKKDINGTGNDSNSTDNYFYGNRGDNVLRGVGAGWNEFHGGKGNDTYIGVDGVFDLYFLSKGDGRETVKTYVDGEDKLNLYGFKGVQYDTPFEELQAHFKQKGGDTWIDMRHGDALILKGVDSDDLDASDFQFTF